MSAKNDITGDPIASRAPTDAYRDGWDRIFGNRDSRTAKTDSRQNVGTYTEVQTKRNSELRPINWLPSDML